MNTPNPLPGLPECNLRMQDVDSTHAIIHEGAHVSSDASIGCPGEWRDKPTRFPAVLADGVTVREYATVHAGCDRPTVVGADTLLMTKSHVGHDAIIGRDCEIGVSAVIGGCCVIGSGVKVGLGATVKPFVKIGEGARIGMGAAVLRDVPAGEIWAGVPAKRITREVKPT